MKGLKTTISLLLAVLVMPAFCTGCNPTNQVPTAAGKGQTRINKGQSEAATTKTDENSTPGNAKLTDAEARDILKQLIPKAADIYGMFNGYFYFKHDAKKTIPGEEEYCLVTGTRGKMNRVDFPTIASIADLKKAVEDVFTKDAAQKEFYSVYLETKDTGLPLYKEYKGQLYVNTHNGGHGKATTYFMDTAKILSQKGDVVVARFKTTEYDAPYLMTVKIQKVNGKWLLASGASFGNEVSADGPPPPPKKQLTIKLDGNSYHASYTDDVELKSFIFATMTDKGVVWVPSPAFGYKDSVIKRHPDSNFFFYLSPKSETNLSIRTSKHLFMLPQTVKDKDSSTLLYTFVAGVHAANSWVIYTTYYKASGAKLAAWYELHAYQLDTKKDIKIAVLHKGGGYAYHYAIYKSKIFYEQERPGKSGSPTNRYNMYDLKTHETRELKHYEEDPNPVISYSDGGKRVQIKLNLA